MFIEFYGATSGVTGSCHILRTDEHLILLDCGLIQGRGDVDTLNREPFPFSPDEISAVVLSHAHIDHSGRLPRLVKQGYKGPIYAQNATIALCDILLQDSAHIQQRDVEYENKWRKRKKKPLIEPLYSIEDAQSAISQFSGIRYREKHEILPGISIRFQDAGHIMGSCNVEIWLKENGVERKIVFSGDIGQYDTPILNDPAVIEEADQVIIEGTYGNRLHRDRKSTIEEIGEIISQAKQQQGNILIPAFAVGRSQEMLYYLAQHYNEWGLENWEVYLDSPMAIKASQVYWDFPHLYDDEATKLRHNINSMPKLKNLHFTVTAEESMAINEKKSGAIIIASSGMLTAGRIVHHLKRNISRQGAHVMIIGYQSPGTLGRRLVDGDDEVKIHGDYYPVRAKIHTVGGLSAHGDADELLRWAGGFKTKPPMHIVHGEKKSKLALRDRLQTELNLSAEVPEAGQILKL